MQLVYKVTKCYTHMTGSCWLVGFDLSIYGEKV